MPGFLIGSLVLLIAVLHLYFLVLEMFLWTRPFGLRAFRLDRDFAVKAATLAANQGLYNGFLAAGLIWSLFHPDPGFVRELRYFFLGCVLVAGAYGGATVNRRIFWVQGLPAAIALLGMAITGGF